MGKHPFAFILPFLYTGLCETLSNHVRESCRCDRDRAWGAVKAKLPILSWLPRYNFRTDFVGDVISGTTVAIMHIPQGESLVQSHILINYYHYCVII